MRRTRPPNQLRGGDLADGGAPQKGWRSMSRRPKNRIPPRQSPRSSPGASHNGSDSSHGGSPPSHDLHAKVSSSIDQTGRLPPPCRTPDSQPYSHDEENSVSTDALSGAMAVGGGLPQHRLRALFALSRDRVLSRGPGVRRRLADGAVQDANSGDVPVSPFRVRRGRPSDRSASRDTAIDRVADRRTNRRRIWDRAL